MGEKVDSMNFKLVYIDKNLGKEWNHYFSEEKMVAIIEGDITEIKADAIVSPANSFGFMDGGLDLIISEKFGWHIQEDLQKKINSSEEKELLVGKSITLQTGNQKIPYLISAPTMRVPMNFNIPTSINAYLAMKAILIESIKNTNINSILIPGLCTGAGRMPHHIAAKQMFQAFDEVVNGNKMSFASFKEAQAQQLNLNENASIYYK